ncbi:MAG: phospholipid/cholesterol/gamma-HCH transport system substrate-binding protein, partial [Solirubrobacteraceae bacterium]|nr:phospholipid/cholesterol/gamma-HCH transport system substrate-binding protein [Solirubrobacteraceae bacterium]
VLVFMGGSKKHEYSLLFENAGQLVKGDDVQVGGRRVGTIKTIKLTGDNQARVGVVVQEPIAPLHEGTQAIIRATSLSGVANRYISLTPGPQNEPKLDDKAELGHDTTTTIIDLDQLVNTLDEPTRADLQKVIKGFATQLGGQGDGANEAIKYFNPVLSTSRRLVEQLTADEGALTDLLLNASKLSTAVADRSDDLTSLVTNTDQTTAAIAAEDDSLDRALQVLPTTLRRGNTTFVNLRAALADLTVLVDASKPATKDLAPFLRRLRPLVADARPTIADLRRLVFRPGANNDLVDATLKFPKLSRVASPSLRHSRTALADSRKVVAFYRPYAADFVGWLRDFGQGAATYDANGHYARIAPIANAFSFTDNGAGGLLDAIPADARLNDLDQGNTERCPGNATQIAPDGSNDTADLLVAGGCKKGQEPSGP